MIYDFLSHLRSELAAAHAQDTHERGALSPELLADLARYAQTYEVCGLLASLEIDAAAVPEDRVRELRAKVKAARAAELKVALEALDALNPVLMEAIRSLKNPHEAPRSRIRLADFVQAGPNGPHAN